MKSDTKFTPREIRHALCLILNNPEPPYDVLRAHPEGPNPPTREEFMAEWRQDNARLRAKFERIDRR
jgi:hypothetical protein